MADITARVIPTPPIQTRFGDQTQPQVFQSIVTNPSGTVYLTNLADVDSTGLKDGSVPIYDSASHKFKLDQTRNDITDGGNF